MRQWLRKLGWLTQRDKKEEELLEELQFHLEEEAEEAEAAGIPPQEARFAARRELGNLTLVMEDTRATWGWAGVERLFQDLRYSFRTLRRNPGFCAAAVLSLALGIGANTAIFGLLNAIMFRPLAVPDPRQLVEFTNTFALWDTGSSAAKRLYSYPQLEHFQSNAKTLSAVFGWTGLGRIGLGFRGESEIADADACSGNFFTALAIAPQRGRFFTAADDHARATVAVLGHRYWQSRFGADPSVVGKAITINRIPFTVIGIAPASFGGVSVGDDPDLWLPLHSLDRLRPGGDQWMNPLSAWLMIAGRLREGVSRRQAQAELDLMHRRFLAAQLSASALAGMPNVQRFAREGRLLLQPAASGVESGLRNRYVLPLKLLLAVAGIVLLASCVNVANLLLARASGRRHEMAVRRALGAGRGRLMRQAITESLVLAFAAGVLAIPMAWAGGVLLVRLISSGTAPIPLSVDPDWRVFAFTAAVSFLSALLFGLAPAWRLSGANPGPIAAQAARLPGRSSHKLDRTLVAAQVALSVILVTGAGLFLRTLMELSKVDLGCERENVLMFSVDARLAGFSGERAGVAYREVLRRLQHLPGVTSASASIVRPMDDYFNLLDQVNEIDGRQLPESSVIRVAWNATSPGYFSTISTPLISGRDFDLRDDEPAPRVVIISKTLATGAFPGQDPLGHRLGAATIVGVVNDSLYGDVRSQPGPLLYYPLFQHGPGQEFQWGFVSFELRHGAHAGLLDGVRREVASVNPDLPVFRVKTLATQVEQSLIRERLMATLSSVFGALALTLACVGLYGLMAYAVARRTAEIGVRLTLGAPGGHIIWLVLRETLTLALAGLAIGIPIAIWAAQFVKSVLYGITTSDPLTIVATSALLLCTAILAAYVPARNALRVDPVVALKCE